VHVGSLICVVNINISNTTFHFGIFYLTYCFQTYKVYLIIITKTKGKTQQKIHHRIQICTIIVFAMI
jgi:hypothetical protein